MTGEDDDAAEARGGGEQYRQAGPPFAAAAGERPNLSDFRRRVDAFWGDPRTAELQRTLIAGREPEPVTPTRALETHLGDSLAILGSLPDEGEFRLRKSLTLRDGQIVSISGDAQPLADDERILVVTATTTVLRSDSLAVETNVLVFEREVGD
jgi:hypothetical protein